DTVHQLDVLHGSLARLARQWGSTLPTNPPPCRQTQSWDSAPTASDAEFTDERMLLGCLSDQPDQLDAGTGWLRPEDFADTAHSRLYRGLAGLHHRGEPVDSVTVLWEAQRRGALADGTLTADTVLDVCRTLGAGDPTYHGWQTLRSSVLRTAAN